MAELDEQFVSKFAAYAEPGRVDPIGQKLLREVELTEQIGQGFAHAAREAFKYENLPETAGKVAVSAALGVVMGRYAVTSGLQGALTRSAMAGSSLAFVGDVVGNGFRLSEILTDTWHSPADRDAHLHVARETLGKFAFDTALMTAGGLAGNYKMRIHLPVHAAAAKAANQYYCHDLDLPSPNIPTLAALQNRIVSSRVGVENIAIPVDNATLPFVDMADFQARGLKEVLTKTREYTVSDLATKIVVPESYAQKLDQVRSLRLASEKPGVLNYWVRKDALLKLNASEHSESILPEEFIPLLEHTPDPVRVKRLLVLDSDFAHNALYQQGGLKDFRALASANSLGEVRYHKKSGFWSEDDIGTMNHEWSHIIGFNDKSASQAFNAAAKIEGTDFVLRDYALYNNDENWAVHFGNGLLHPSKLPFLETVEQAPVRSAVLGRSLADVLREVPQEQRGEVHEHYLRRSKYIQEKVVPAVITDLNKFIEAGGETAAPARTVMDYISGAER
jgi:hypothetical protein